MVFARVEFSMALALIALPVIVLFEILESSAMLEFRIDDIVVVLEVVEFCIWLVLIFD